MSNTRGTSPIATGPADTLAGDVAAAFRAAMRAFSGVVTLITTRTNEGEWRGMAATAVTSVSMEPPVVLACVNRTASLYPTLMATRLFCVNAMHQEHYALMPAFTKPEQRQHRFRTGSWHAGRDGMPYLVGAQANIFCALEKGVPVGTHDVIFGRVTEVVTRPDCDPLLYGNGTYWRQTTR